MKYLITYSNSIIEVPDDIYPQIAKIIENPANRFLDINGKTYNINDIKYAGDKKGAPIIDGWNNVPANQSVYEEIGFGRYLISGDTKLLESNLEKKNGLIWGKYTSEEFQAFAKKIKDDHLARMKDWEKMQIRI